MNSSAVLLVIAGGFFLIIIVLVIFFVSLLHKYHDKQQREGVETLFLDAITKHTVDSIYLKDSQHRILMANDRFFENLERPQDQVLGFTDIDFFGEEYGRRTMSEEKVLLDTGEPLVSAVEGRILETGQRHYVLTTKVPVIQNGRIAGIFGITREFTEIAKMQEELAHSATHDSLTGLSNRAAITFVLHDALAEKNPVAVLFIDMDDFKHFNDEYGHDFGDELLKLIAHRMESTLRKDDLVGRLSGDEFVIILRGIHTKQEAEIATRKLIECFRQPFLLHGHSVVCTFSIGIFCTAACEMTETVSVQDLIRSADRAMYAVKKEGKGGYQFSDGICDD